MQTLNSVIHLQVPWPTILITLLDGLSSVSGSFGDSVNALECLYANQSHTDFYLSALICAGILPFIFVAFLSVYWFFGATNSSLLGCGKKVLLNNSAASHALAAAAETAETAASVGRKDQNNNSSGTRRGRSGKRSRSMILHDTFQVTATDSLIMSSVLFWFMILPSILRMSFVSFECVGVDNEYGTEERWLLLDLEQRCYEGKHVAMLIVSAAMCFFHAVVVPGFIIMVLHRTGEKDRQSLPRIMYRFGLMHSGYRKEKYWWEIVVMIRKILIIIISTFVSSDQLQLHFSLAVLVISLHMHDTNRPFGSGDRHTDITETEDETLERMDSEKSLHRYEMGSLLCLLFLIWSGVLFYFNLCGRSGIVACSILIVIVLGSNAAYLMVLGARCLKEWSKRNHLDDKMVHLAHTFHLDGLKKSKVVMHTNPGRTTGNDVEMMSMDAKEEEGEGEDDESGELKLNIRVVL